MLFCENGIVDFIGLASTEADGVDAREGSDRVGAVEAEAEIR
jgi:hypothetical protein